MDNLVERLSQEQPIRMSLRPDATPERLRAALERGYVHVLFEATGTELRLELEPKRCDWSNVDWNQASGHVQLFGRLVLNYVRVIAHASVRVETLAGRGRLEIVEEVSPAQLERAQKEVTS